MKKIFALLLVFCVVFALGACGVNNADTDETTPTKAQLGNEEWNIKPDESIFGAWKSVDENLVIYFTNNNTMRVISGSAYVEQEVVYGIHSNGTSLACVYGEYLGSSWSYTVDGKTLTINYPVYDDDSDNVEDFKDLVFKAVDYSITEPEVKDAFVLKKDVLGTWSSTAEMTAFEFKDNGRGTATFESYVSAEDDSLKAITEVQIFSYVVTDDTIEIYMIDSNGKELSDKFKFTVADNKLTLDGVTLYLNGEGDPDAE